MGSTRMIFFSNGFFKNVLVFDGSEELQGLVKGADVGLLFFYKKHLELARNSGNSICKVSTKNLSS